MLQGPFKVSEPSALPTNNRDTWWPSSRAEIDGVAFCFWTTICAVSFLLLETFSLRCCKASLQHYHFQFPWTIDLCMTRTALCISLSGVEVLRKVEMGYMSFRKGRGSCSKSQLVVVVHPVLVLLETTENAVCLCPPVLRQPLQVCVRFLRLTPLSAFKRSAID